MYCRNCGTELNPDGRCPKCGAVDPMATGAPETVAPAKPKKKKKHIFRKIILGILAVCVISSLLSRKKSTRNSVASTPKPAVTQAAVGPTEKPTIKPTAEPEVTPAPVQATGTPTPASIEAPAAETANPTGIRPEFQAAMDSYKEFFEKYAAFMQNYMAHPESVASMMGDYLTMMTQYTDTMEKLEAIDESTLSPEEDALYIQTMADIEKMLLSVAG